MYIPPSKYTPNLYTSIGKYTLDGEDYEGNYFIVTMGGKESPFTGKNPQDGKPKPLQLKDPDEQGNEIVTSEDFLQQQLNENPKKLINATGDYYNAYPERPPSERSLATPYSPIITKENNKQLSIIRYFLKRNNSLSYIEVNEKEFLQISQKSKKGAWDLYDYVSFNWLINGEIYNIYNRNRKIVLDIEKVQSTANPKGKGWKKFSQTFKDNFLQFCQTKNETGIYTFSGIRTYPNQEKVPNNFPDAYRLGNMEENENQQCSNCIYFKNPNETEAYCSKWNATARWNYWCKSYKLRNIKPSISNQPNPTPIQQPQQQTYTPPPSIGGGISSGGGGGGY